jgi:UDP-N-acetylmuramoyl-tripeptide--D-alanyl-D-alanine ligase
MTVADIVKGTKADLWRTTLNGLRQGVTVPLELHSAVGPIVSDSRHVTPGAVFFALPGTTTHGHQFVTDAFRSGASGVVVTDLSAVVAPPPDRYVYLVPDSLRALHDLARYWRQQHQVTVVGVTGSIGKTSVKEAIAAALCPLGSERVLKNTGNLNTEVGLPLELLRLTDQHRIAVLEMGMYQRGDIALLAAIARPAIGVVTTVLPVHLERLGSLERIAQTKAELVHALPEEGLAILNGDNEWTRAMAHASAAPVYLFGRERRYDFWAGDIVGHGLQGFTATYHHGGHSLRITCPTPGEHNVMTLLPAIAVAHRLGVPWEAIGEALASFRLQERLTVLPGPNGSMILDDRYNAMATSVSAALAVLKQIPGRHFALLGDMYELGSEEEAQHRAVGRAAATLDGLILLGERTHWIAEEAQAHGLAPQRIVQVADVEQAIAVARELLRAGDTMLVKGSRGLRMERIVDALRSNQETVKL